MSDYPKPTTLSMGTLKKALAEVSENDLRPVKIRVFLNGNCDLGEVRDLVLEPDDLDALLGVKNSPNEGGYILCNLEAPFLDDTAVWHG